MLPFTDHALFEMKRRGISEKEVEKVFQQPEQKIELEGDREIWQTKVVLDSKTWVIRIVVELKPRVAIVTVYKSSKVKKYWRADA